MLNVKLLGHTSISYKNENLTNDLGKKTIALLFLLVVNEGKYITKDKLSVYLWPESNEESSKYNVRYNLWMLNKIIPEDKNGNELIITDVNSCTLNKEYSLNCDLLSIMKCEYENAKIEELSEVVDKAFSGDVMEGWFFNKCYDFNELILMYRMQIENKQMKILKSLSRKYYEKEQFNKALAVLKKAEQFDPNNETIAIWTLKTYSALGERVAGINYYKIFESRLWKDLNIMPNDELQSLYENLFDSNLPYDISENPEEKTQPSRSVTLYGFGISSIEWSLISCIIDSICDVLPETLLAKIDPDIISELGFINKKIIIGYNDISNSSVTITDDIPHIRIMQDFSSLLDIIEEKCKINIEIEAFNDSDRLSRDVINYIEKVHKEINIIK